jgi:hypothetical protein
VDFFIAQYVSGSIDKHPEKCELSHLKKVRLLTCAKIENTIFLRVYRRAIHPQLSSSDAQALKRIVKSEIHVSSV